jgi:cytochrome c biogenesis protein CcmG/thiol:disulfide interchange protein DsbE
MSTSDLDLDPDLLDPDAPEVPLWRRVLVTWVGPLLAAVVLFQLVGWVRAPTLPERAPDFTVRTPEGESLSLQQFRGRTVVLNFWATWCGPCRMEAPSFASFAQANPDITVLGLAQDRQPGKVRRAADELGMTYPVALADPATLAAYGITTFPTTVVVGPDGAVEAAHTGLLLRPQLWWMTR